MIKKFALPSYVKKIVSAPVFAAIIAAALLPGCKEAGALTPAAEFETADIEDVQDNQDIDLTILSSTMVYAQVYDMMYYPEKFVGKTVRMEGQYSDYFDQAKGKHYFGCIIMDATACCAQGVEFEPLPDYKYPEDYPEEGDMVVVDGVFDVYTEDDGNYCTLRNAHMIKSE